MAQVLKTDSEKRQPQDGTKLPRMEMVSMVIVFHVMLLATKPWIVEAMQKEVLEIPTTLSDVGHVTALAILLHIAIP